MQKPIVVARQDFVANIVKLINEAGSELPMFVIDDVLDDVRKQVQAEAQKQYQSAKEAYEQQLANENKETNEVVAE